MNDDSRGNFDPREYVPETPASERAFGGTSSSGRMDAISATDALPPAGATTHRTRYEPEDEHGRLREGVEQVADRVRSNPIGSLAMAVGAGLVLHKTGLLGSVFSNTVSRSSSRSSSHYSPEEERLIAWLNDAYALEKAQIPVLENHADDADAFPEVRRKDLEHLEKTRRHAKLVKECLDMLGTKPSKVKAAVGRVSGAFNAMTTEPFDDEVVRNFLQDFAAENLEIASYEAIIAAAEVAGHPRIARICEEILADEEEMVDWLRDNLPRVVRRTLVDL
jgi:ferritin-like metal-binding protein YciE